MAKRIRNTKKDAEVQKSNNKDAPKSVRVAFYIRVSTQEQDLEGYSPEFQKESLEEQVERKGYKGWHTKKEWQFNDVKSGGNTVDRTELNKLMELVRAKKVDLVLVWRIDRMSRKLSDLLELFEEMDKHGVGFASVKEDLDFTGAIGKLIFQIFGALAEFERENIKMRTEEGKLMSAKHGNYVGGAIPYGYKGVTTKGTKGTKLKMVPEEQKWVKQIFTWFVQGKKTLSWIEGELNKRGVAKGVGNPETRGTQWYAETVKGMLQNDIYRGAYITNRWRLISKKPEVYEERPEEVWIYTEVEPCIDITIFYMAQERFTQEGGMRSETQGGGQNKYLLRGKLRERDTGKGFVGYLSEKKTKNYRRKKYTDTTGEVHSAISISAEKLEPFVLEHIERAILQPGAFLRIHKERSADGKKLKEIQEELEHQESILSKQNRRLEGANEKWIDEEMTDDEYHAAKEKYEGKRDKALEEAEKIKKEITRIGQYDAACIDLKSFSEQFRKNVGKLTHAQKQRLVHLLVERIEIYETETERRAKVWFRFDPKAIAGAIPTGRTDFALTEEKKHRTVRCQTHEVVGRVGIEPTAKRLRVSCSTTELPTHI